MVTTPVFLCLIVSQRFSINGNFVCHIFMKFGTRVFYKAPNKSAQWQPQCRYVPHFLTGSNKTTNSESACFKGGIASDRQQEKSLLLLYFLRGGGIKYDLVCVCVCVCVCLKSEMWNKRGQVNKQSVKVPLSCQPANNGPSACRWTQPYEQRSLCCFKQDTVFSLGVMT